MRWCVCVYVRRKKSFLLYFTAIRRAREPFGNGPGRIKFPLPARSSYIYIHACVYVCACRWYVPSVRNGPPCTVASRAGGFSLRFLRLSVGSPGRVGGGGGFFSFVFLLISAPLPHMQPPPPPPRRGNFCSLFVFTHLLSPSPSARRTGES